MSASVPVSIEPPTSYQQYLHRARYSRWRDDDTRRETWSETVSRYFDFMTGHLKDRCNFTLTPELRSELELAVLNLDVMPSMRAMATAGPALLRDEAAGFNCTALAIDRPQAFDELMYLCMCGSGVGFSVERSNVAKLPIVAEMMNATDTTIIVPDSKIGWSKSLRELIAMLYAGQIPSWDLSRLRPAGARLKTFGGRSSGPAPLDKLFRSIVQMFKAAAGRQLTTLECHDICCMIAEVIVVGGTRRSALISLSDVDDVLMRHAKSGNWYDTAPYRAMSNNSYVIDDHTQYPFETFLDEWKSLYLSRSGERGIFSRVAGREQLRKLGRRDPNHPFIPNPCCEIKLRPNQMCNLTEVMIRPTDTHESLRRKVRIATILGTFQSTLTNFRYLSAIWKRNADEERLLGVSFTGIFDAPLMFDVATYPDLPERLANLRQHAVEVNADMAKTLGINASTAITCVKPSGTVSQLTDTSSGIHPRYAPYYVRRVIGDLKDPLTSAMIKSGIPYEPHYKYPLDMVVFCFPMRAPEHGVTRHDISAIQHMELWLLYLEHWCEHQPSCTITVKADEWMAVGAWVWEHIDQIAGLSFFPEDNGVYEQPPYQECDETTYRSLLAKIPTTIDWSLMQEIEDQTTSAQERACAGGVCEL